MTLARSLLVALCLASLPATAAPTATVTAAAGLDANDIVAKIQKFYVGVTQVTAQFRQTVFYNVTGISKTSDGGVYISKPGKMRWDYLEDKKAGGTSSVSVKKSFISDGTNLYVVDTQNKQVITKNVSQDLLPVAITFLYGKGDLATEFNASIDASGTWGSAGDVVLKLTPKQPSAQYKTLFLVVNPSDDHVKQSIIIDAGDNRNQFMFFKQDFAASIKDSTFQFDPKSVPSYRVIDANQQGSAAPPAGSGMGSGVRLSVP
jgi:outer membrane lipoprotein carrier protein